MADKNSAAAPAAAPAAFARKAGHIMLLQDWGGWLAGKVVFADLDLLASLDKDGAKFRSATDREISLAGTT